MSEPWLAPTLLRPSTWRRRLLAAAGWLCACVGGVFVQRALESPAEARTQVAMLLAGGVLAAMAAWRAVRAARQTAVPPHELSIDAEGRIRLAAATAAPSYAGPLFVALRTPGSAPLLVWCDSLPRVGFRRLIVAARWGAATPAS